MGNLVISTDEFAKYMQEVNRFPLLTKEEEFDLAVRYRRYGDKSAAQKLIISNLRFVVKIANEYRSYGCKIMDLIQEGSIGLMMAVKKFNPFKGYRLISYAVWWIRAYIQNFIMKTWSLVKIGTTHAQRKLFYKLSGAKEAAKDVQNDVDFKKVSDSLNVTEADVIEMDGRLSGKDFSLDTSISDDTEHTYLDMLPDSSGNLEENLADLQEKALVQKALTTTLPALSTKERFVLEKRFFSDNPLTLQEIGDELNLTRERVRQIEQTVLLKLKKEVELKLLN